MVQFLRFSPVPRAPVLRGGVDCYKLETTSALNYIVRTPALDQRLMTNLTKEIKPTPVKTNHQWRVRTSSTCHCLINDGGTDLEILHQLVCFIMGTNYR